MSDLSLSPQRGIRFKSPLAALAASFALGILWARWFHNLPGIPALLAAAGTCILIGLVLLRANRETIAVGLVLVSMALAGAADALRWRVRFPLNHVRYLESLGVTPDTPVILTGRIVSTPFPTAHGMQFDLEVQRAESGAGAFEVQGRVRLRVQRYEEGLDANHGPSGIEFGDTVRATAHLYRPRLYQNPGSFNFRGWMEDIEDLYWIGTVRSPRAMEILDGPSRHSLATVVERSRQRLLRAIDDLYPPWSREGRNGAVLKAVLWGDRPALDSATIEDFRKTGLYHLLVIAGLHIGLIALLVDLLLRRVGLRRVTRAVMILGFLACYSLLVEQRAPTLRASLIVALYLTARIFDRRHSPLNSLGGVALMLLYWHPAWLFESGFQLSFSAAFLIVGVAVPILNRTTEPYRLGLRRINDVLLDDHFSPRIAQARLDLRTLNHWLRGHVRLLARFPRLSRYLLVMPLRAAVWVANILLFSAILQLGLILPMVETFHRVTLAGVGLNALAIPMMTLLLALALPINLLAVASPGLAAWPAKLLSLVMSLLFEMTHLPGLASWLSYRVPSPPVWVACGFAAAFVIAGFTLRYARRCTTVALAACAVFVGLVAIDPFPPRLPRKTLQMTALDCGHGEALFIVLPDGATMLVNAGGGRAEASRQDGARIRQWNTGEEIVSPYLWSQGIKRIDVVALTDPSPENFEGVQAIIENFQVRELWFGGETETAGYSAFLDRIAARGIPTRTLVAGDRLLLGGAKVRVMKQQPAGPWNSISLGISAGGHSFILPEFGIDEAEDKLIAFGRETNFRELAANGKGNLPASVNYAPRSNRRVILITSEPSGPRGAGTNADSRQDLSTGGAQVFRTAIDGATTVQWNNDSLVVVTYKNSGTKIHENNRGGASPNPQLPALLGNIYPDD